MSKRYLRKLACLLKMEATYGTDSAPTAAANAIQMSDVTFTPLAGSQEDRGLLLPHLGNQGVVLTGEYVQLEGSVQIAGAGAAGTVPAYGPLFRSCGLAEVITAGEKVEYTPVSDAFESSSIYFVQDKVRHVLVGCRGNVSFQVSPQGIPRWRFTLMGLIGTISDLASNPAVDLAKFQNAIVVNTANSSLKLHGIDAIAGSLQVDLGNQVQPYFMIGAESIEIGDRSTSGTAVVEAKTLATVNWFEKARARTRGPLVFSHGKTPGNIVEISAPAVEVGRPTQGNVQGILNYSVPLSMIPVAGNDEAKFTIR